MVVRVFYLERFSSSLYLKSREKNLSHSATLRIFLMISSVMYDETLCTYLIYEKAKIYYRV